jgi:hypothetical protein
MLTVFMSGLWSATDDDRAWRDDVRAALRIANISDDAAARYLDIGASQFSDQMSLRAHLSQWRLRRLPPAFHRALNAVRAERFGQVIVEQAELRELVKEYRDMKKRMVRMAPGCAEREIA